MGTGSGIIQDDPNVVLISKILSVPGIKVNRREFLKKMFGDKLDSKSFTKLFEAGPQLFYSEKELRQLAEKRIKVVTATSASASFMAGLPGAFFMAATVPADIAQFYGLSLRLAQEIAYIYGVNDFWENETLTQEATQTLMLYLGVMLGVTGTDAVIRVITPNIGKQVSKNLLRKPLTQGAIYPIMKKVFPYIAGKQLTKKGLSQFATKAIPVLGGIVSGGITVATMLPMGKKLSKELSKLLHYSEADYVKDLALIGELTDVSH